MTQVQTKTRNQKMEIQSIPELDRRSTFLLGGHDTLWTTSQDQQQIPNEKGRSFS